MGAEGVPWIGLSPFVAEPHLIQNIGDGTLSHSGTLAIRASVAAGVDITFKVLYNSAVAMTGGQDVTGLMDIPSMTRALEAEGVARIVVCAEDPRRYGRRARWAPGVEVVGRDELPRIQERLQQVSGVSVIVYDQRCAAEARRLRKRGLLAEPPRQVLINEAVCEGCGDCSTKSNCLSVLPLDTEFGEKRRIDNLSCNRDYTCLDGDCPSFVTLKPRPARRGDLPATTRPAPAGRSDVVERPRPADGLAAGAVGAGGGSAVRHLLHRDRRHGRGQCQPHPGRLGGGGRLPRRRHGPDRPVAEGGGGGVAPAPGLRPPRSGLGHHRSWRRRPVPVG